MIPARKKFQKLRGKIASEGMNLEELAEAINIQAKDGKYGKPKANYTPIMMSHRLCAKTPWSVADAILICDVLNIPHNEIMAYFVDPIDVPRHRRKPRKLPDYKVEGGVIA